MRPLCIDLYCGLGGFSEGFLAEGYDCIGFDIEKHDYGTGSYPGQLVLQDVLTLHGSQCKDAAVIVASPPCQLFSYTAMPWSKAKRLKEWYFESPERLKDATALFDACFRIQLEAIKAAGQYIPLIVENVRGAQPWVGRSRWHYGSFHLWGDVPALMPITPSRAILKPARAGITNPADIGLKANPDGTNHTPGSWFKIADSKNRGAQSGLKLPGNNGPRRWEDREVRRLADGTKGGGGGWFNETYAEQKANGHVMHGRGTSFKSNARKAASAQIAKIPFPLARWIARCYRP